MRNGGTTPARRNSPLVWAGPGDDQCGMGLGVIILTGGGASRMGADKAALLWNGRRAVDRLAQLARDLSASATLTAGGLGYGLPMAAEDPPGGGPVAGIVAGAIVLRAQGCSRALVLAVDAPTILAADLQALLAAAPPGAAFADLHLPLVLSLHALPADAGAGWPMGRLVERAGLVRLSCPPEARARLRGANTPEERQVLLEALILAESAQGSGAV